MNMISELRQRVLRTGSATITADEYNQLQAEWIKRVGTDEIERLHAALSKINDIRNSIIAHQKVNFSEHVYPLVAALNAAGFQGMPYPEAVTNYGTVTERAAKAEAESQRLRAESVDLQDVLARNGFVRCDIPACNCGSWHHRYGLPERFEKIKELLSEAGHPLCNKNGNLVRNALKELIAENAELRADAERYRFIRTRQESTLYADLKGNHVSLDAAIDAARSVKP